MPWKCVKCGYETEIFEGNECQDCGGLLEESETKVDWLGDKEDGDLNNPDKDDKEKENDDVPL